MNRTYHVAPRFKGPAGQEDMPYLLSAGPVTTSRTVKLAMLADYAGDDPEFTALLAEVRRDLRRLAGGNASHECVLLPGPGAAAMEAVFAALAPAKRKKTLVISNGVDGALAASLLGALGRPVTLLEKDEQANLTAADVAAALDADAEVSHVWLCHCETSTGRVNPVTEIGNLLKERGKTFMVDATASLGALAPDMVADKIDVLVGTPDVCIEGVPGISFAVLRRDLLISAEDKAGAGTLDLHAQWKSLEGPGRFRFTPPTHVLAALRMALRELDTEGGSGMRRARYQRNAEEVVTRMRAMGFHPLLADGEAGPIIQAFLAPRDKKFDFARLQEGLRQRGFLIAAGATRHRASFRVGCIGQIDHKVIKAFAAAMEEVLKDMDIQEFTPAGE